MAAEVGVLKLVCEKLESVGIPYMLTGSFAANFFAVPRMTRDIDLVIEVLDVDLDKFAQLFEGDFYFEKEALVQAINYTSMFNIIHQDTVCKIDFIIRKKNPYRQLEFQRRQRVLFDGAQIWIVSPEDLIISKLFWAKDSLSQMQLRDVRNILFNAKDLDVAYMEKWVTELGLVELYDKAKNP